MVDRNEGAMSRWRGNGLHELAPLAPGLMAVVLLAGCAAVGPDHERPHLPLPSQYPQADAKAAAHDPTGAELAADWWRLFGSDELDALVDRALAHNSDIAQAVARVQQADARMRQAGAALLPGVELGAGAARQRIGVVSAPPDGARGSVFSIGLSAAFELDFWGRVRRLDEAARAELLASAYAADTVRLTVAALTAQTWFALRSLDEQVQLTRDTLRTRDDGARLLRLRFEQGTGSQLDVEQAEGLRATSAVLLRELRRQRAVAGSQLALLTGQFELALAERGLATPGAGAQEPGIRGPHAQGSATQGRTDPTRLDQAWPSPPPGLPSALLERRPDVRSAEQQLAAATARIGAARAAMLPTLSLTGALGGESTALSDLLKSPGRFWRLGVDLAAPVFDGGRRAAVTDEATARQQDALAHWRGTVETAFKEVADALGALQAARDSSADLARAEGAASRALALAQMRYDAGYTAYLDLLDAQRTAAAARLDLARNRLARLAASVDLMRALGGGWQAPAPGVAQAHDVAVP
jgi:multidrug efflux system outer membrane protein